MCVLTQVLPIILPSLSAVKDILVLKWLFLIKSLLTNTNTLFSFQRRRVYKLFFAAQDVNDVYSLRYPKLYAPGQLNFMFNKKVFAQSIAEGVISSLVLFFIPYGTFYGALRPDGLDVSDHQALATVISAALIVVVTLRVSRFPLRSLEPLVRYSI